MHRTSLRSGFAAPFAVLLLLGASGCGVPLGPGYQIVKESREVRFVRGDPPQVRISGRFTFKNSGTTDLEFIDLSLPDQKGYGRSDLRVEWDGHPAKLVGLPEQFQALEPTTLRLPFDSVWKRGETRELLVEYAFTSPGDIGDRVTIGAEDFHLGWRGWSPLPQPPKHFLSPYPRRPDRTTYAVLVPSDFLVLGGGRFMGQKPSLGGVEYRFELRKNDLTPFVVAGRYVASGAEAKANGAIFWTLQPLKENPRAAIERLSAVWSALQEDFGPLEKNIRVPHIVESASLREHLTGEAGPAAVAFPGGVAVSSALLSSGLTSEIFQERVTHALAHDWFGDEVFFGRYTALGLGEGLPEYATIVAEQAQNGEAGRRRRVMRYLREYDEARANTEETALGTTTLTDASNQRQIALAKAALFFVALEDVCGETPMRNALKHVVITLRGQEVTYDVLRSQLEQFSGKNLADLFRVWLNEKGVPDDFRARYTGPGSREAK